MSTKQCSYCEAKTKSNVSLVDQGWQAIQLWVTDNKGKTQMFTGRACPNHHALLNEKATEFFNMRKHGLED